MAMAALTVDSIQKILGRDVDEVLLVIAKNSVLGLENEQIAGLLGVERNEIDEIQQTQDYKDVRLLIGAEYAKTLSEKDMTWDSIESAAIENLAKRVPLERDTDTLLRIAAVANKAQRRQTRSAEQVLDPSNAAARVPLTLTRRFVERINKSGAVEREETQQISVTNGSAVNPSFNDIDKLLGVSARQPIPGTISYKTHDPDVSLSDLDQAFEQGGR